MANNLFRFMSTSKHTHGFLMRTIFRKAFFLRSSKRDYSSALYISGDVAQKVFAFLTPYLDVNERFANMKKLQNELTLREMNVDVIQLKKAWEFYQKMDADKCALESHHKELTNQIAQLHENGEHTSKKQQEIIKLNTQRKVIREDLKTMKQAIWELDKNVIENILKLPNELDSRTPAKETVILKNVGTVPELSEKNTKSHVDIGTKLGLLEYQNPMHYYLCNNAALFELAVLAYAGKILGRTNDMLKVSGTDFSRSLLVEGAGLDHEDPMTAFILENEEVEKGSSNRMHLVGGTSLISFLALHAKQLINPTDFPLKYFATGRQYTPLLRDTQSCGLLTVCQASAAHTFIMVKDAKSEEYRILFEKFVESVCHLYDDLCDHYRVVMRPASELQLCESLRVSFELWSSFANRYIEVGHLSTYGDYISKRLLITYQTPNGRDFPAIISGTVLSVPRLLACLLERNPHEFVIPPKIAEFMPIDDYVAV